MRNHKTAKRFISILLCAAMLTAMLPAGIFPVFTASAAAAPPERTETRVTDIDALPVITVSYLPEFGAPNIIDNVNVGERQFKLTLDAPLPYTVSVDYRTLESSAKAGSLYKEASGTVTFEPGETEKSVTITFLPDGFAGTDAETRWSEAKSMLVQFHNPVNALLEAADCSAYNGISRFDIQNNGYSLSFKFAFLKSENTYEASRENFYNYYAYDSLSGEPNAKYRVTFDAYYYPSEQYVNQYKETMGKSAYRRRDFALNDSATPYDNNRSPGFGQESTAFKNALADSNASGVAVGMELFRSNENIPMPKGMPLRYRDSLGYYHDAPDSDFYAGGRITVLSSYSGSDPNYPWDTEFYDKAAAEGYYQNWPEEYLDNTFKVWFGGHEYSPYNYPDERGSRTEALDGGKRAYCYLPREQYPLFTQMPLTRFLIYDQYVMGTPDGYPDRIDAHFLTVGQFSTELIDFIPPVVRKVTAPTGSPVKPFVPGSVIPVTLEFSEPVAVDYDAYILVNGVAAPLADKRLYGSGYQPPQISKYAAFLYTVKETDNPTGLEIEIPDPSMFTDISGNILAVTEKNTGNYWDSLGIDFTGPRTANYRDDGAAYGAVYMQTPFEWAAIADFSADFSAYDYKDTVYVTLTDNITEEISLWLRNSVDKDNNLLGGAYLAVRNPLTGELDTYGFTWTGDEPPCTYTAQFPASKYAPYASKIQLALFYGSDAACEDGVFFGGKILYEKLLYIDLSEPKYVTAVIIDEASYPAYGKIYFSDENAARLSASVNPIDADFPEIAWSSSDDSVAEIDDDGYIWPQKAGKVKFTATAANGAAEDMAVSAETTEFEIVDDTEKFLQIKNNVSRFSARKDEEVTVKWTTNLKYAATDFTVKLFDAEDMNEVYGYEGKLTKSELTIDGALLQKISKRGAGLSLEPAYIFEISAKNPDHTEITLSATGYIIVYPQPPSIKFDTAGDTYITDNSVSFTVEWTMKNLDPASDSFELVIIKNGDLENPVYSAADFVYGLNSCTLTIDRVANGLKDTYSIQAMAMNETGICIDAVTLYVYNKDALEIIVKDARGGDVTPADGTLTLSNRSMISDLYNTGGSDAILELRRDINLQRYISINYGDYAWSVISDQIEWLSDNTAAATVNYRQATMYEPLSNFTYVKYPPGTDFSLAGVGNGTAKITATHSRSGQSVELDTVVETLKNQLYLFQFYPKQETRVSYVNGEGRTVSLVSDPEGALAVYEPSGISGNVSVQSGSGEWLYLGTVYNNKLKSGEYDSANLGLYPVNIFQLRNTKIEVYIKNPDGGTPWSGAARYGIAVYKNGRLCEEALIHYNENKSLNVPASGLFRLNLDASKFWVEKNDEELKMSDRLEFEFIIECGSNARYYPMYFLTDGTMNTLDVVRTGANIAMLRSNGLGAPNPFLAAQKVTSPALTGAADVITYDGSVGPGKYVPQETLTSSFLWWGEDPDVNYGLRFELQHGARLGMQSTLTRRLPFYDAALSVNDSILADATIGPGTAFNLGAGEGSRGRLVALQENGYWLFMEYTAFKITNGIGMSDPKDSPSIGNTVNDLEHLLNTNLFDIDESISDTLGVVETLQAVVGALSLGQLGITYEATHDPLLYYAYMTLLQNEAGNWQATGTFAIPEIFELKINAYIKGEVRFDAANGDYNLQIVEGGLAVGFEGSIPLGSVTILIPVPVTFSLALEIGLGIGMQIHRSTGFSADPRNRKDPTPGKVDLLLSLDLHAGVAAKLGLGGMGEDFGVFVGLYGNLVFGAYFGLLNIYNKELSDAFGMDSFETIGGYRLSLKGEIGVKADINLLVVNRSVSYKLYEWNFPIASYADAALIQEYVTKYWMKPVFDSGFTPQKAAMAVFDLYAAGYEAEAERLLRSVTGGLNIEEEKSGWQLESRDYLKNERKWGAPQNISPRLFGAFAVSGAIDDILTNAYPYSVPMVSDDGGIMVYRSDADSADANDTNISWAVSNGTGYNDMGAIDKGAHALPAAGKFDFAGTGNFAAAVWEAQREKVSFADPLSPTDEEIDAMLNNAEIVAAVYNGTDWTATRLTDNAETDMSPVAAAKNGRAFAAWKNMAGSGAKAGEINLDDISSRICYSIYDGTSWSEAAVLLGSAAGINSMNAAMLSDGTAALTYTLDDEVYIIIIDTDGNIKSTSRLSCGGLNENPQITAADFGADGEHFIAAWYQTGTAGDGNVSFAVAAGNGAVSDGLTNAFTQAASSQNIQIGRNFRFAPNSSGVIDGLSILWDEIKIPGDSDMAASSVLYGVKINYDNGKIYLTVPQIVAKTNDEEQFSSFGGRYEPDSDTLNAVMLIKDWSEYDRGSRIGKASAGFINQIETNAFVNQEEIVHDFETMFPFYVTNKGSEIITEINIGLEDGSESPFTGLNLLPNQTIMMYVDYRVPAGQNSIKDLHYTVEAVFTGGDSQYASGLLDIAVPNAGITSMETVSAGGGLRTFRISMQNLSDVEFFGNTAGYSAHLGVYTNQNHTEIAKDADGVDMLYTLSAAESEMLDGSALTKLITYALPDEGFEGGDIRLYAKAWAEDKNGAEIQQYYTQNGASSIVFADPVKSNNGNPIRCSVNQSNASGVTAAAVTVTNLSFDPARNGNLAVTLLGVNGEVLETLLYAANAGGLINLGKEESKSFAFTFSQAGYSVQAGYYTVDPDGMNADISSIQLSAIAVDFDKDVLNYNLSAVNISGTTLSAMAGNPAAKISVLNDSGNTVASGIGAVTYTIPLEAGKTANVRVLVEPENSAASTKTYSFSITNAVNNAEGIIISESGGTVTVTDKNSFGFAAKTWKYCLDGVWSKEFAWGASNSFQTGNTAYMSLYVRVFDADGRYMDSNTLSGSTSTSAGTYYTIPLNPNSVDTLKPPAAEPTANELPEIPDKTITINGITVVYTTDKDGIVTLSPAETQIKQIIEASEYGNITIDLAGISGVTVTGVILEVQPAWFSAAKFKSLTLTLKGVGSVLIKANVFESLSKQNRLLRFTLKKSSLIFDILTAPDGESISYNDRANPLFIRIPVTPAADTTLNGYAGAKKTPSGSAVIPYSVYQDGEITFQTAATGAFDIVYSAKTFADAGGHWASGYIDFVSARGLYQGVGNNLFSPDTSMTRAMFAQVLANLEGVDLTAYKTSRFADAAADAWYAPAVEWAAGAGVVYGYGGGLFGPEDEITREQTAVMLARYAAYKGYDLPAGVTTAFDDEENIASWALEAVKLIQAAGIVSGKPGNIYDPKGMATRAEAAAVFARFIEAYISCAVDSCFDAGKY